MKPRKGCLGCRQRDFAEYQCKRIGMLLMDGAPLKYLEAMVDDASDLLVESSTYHDLWPEEVS